MIVTESMARGMIHRDTKKLFNTQIAELKNATFRKSRKSWLKKNREYLKKCLGDRYIQFEDTPRTEYHLIIDGDKDWFGYIVICIDKKKLTDEDKNYPVEFNEHALARLTQYTKRTAYKELTDALHPILEASFSIIKTIKDGNYLAWVPKGVFFIEMKTGHPIRVHTYIQKEKLTSWKGNYHKKLDFTVQDYYLMEKRHK